MEYGYQPSESSRVLGSLSVLPAAGRSLVNGSSLAQAQMGALVSAELLAAQAGVVPWITLPDGTKGVLAIGSARDRIDRAPPAVRDLYVASHEATHAITIRATSGVAQSPQIARWSPNMLALTERPIGFIPVAVYLTVLGVAALVAGAWYAAEASRATVTAENARLVQLAQVDASTRLAFTQLATTGTISQDLSKNLDPALVQANVNAGGPLPAWLPLAVGGVAVAGTALYLHRRGVF